ncbi:MAG: winged helix-turn-helix domain-containing protein [Pseudomonadota bacterium]
MIARFGSFEIDAQRRQLFASGRALHLTPKAFDLLWLLVEAAPRVVPKREIHEKLWKGGVVADATLVGLVKEIRRVLEEGSAQEVLRTVHRIGYAIDLPVTRPQALRASDGHWLITDQRRISLAEGENVIGRDAAVTVWVDHATLSRRHARITLLVGRAVLEDLGSKNGTMLHGAALAGPTPLISGDEFTCGQLQFRYVEAAAVPPTQTQVHAPGSGSILPPRRVR